jgi:hypothetical protein
MKAVEVEWGGDDDEIVGDDVPAKIKQEQDKKKEQDKKEEKIESEFDAFKEKPEPEHLEPEHEEDEESVEEKIEEKPKQTSIKTF